MQEVINWVKYKDFNFLDNTQYLLAFHSCNNPNKIITGIYLFNGNSWFDYTGENELTYLEKENVIEWVANKPNCYELVN